MSVLFQLVSVTAVERVVPLAGEPVAVPVSRLNSNVAAKIISLILTLTPEM